MDNNSYIKEMHHHNSGSWHQYDFLLNGRYGWQYMLESAEYMAREDLVPLGTVTRTEHPGGKETEILSAVIAAGGNISECPEAVREGSILTAGGASVTLGCMIKVVWLNQTNRLRIFTLEDKTEQIKEYAENLIARKLSPDAKTKKALQKKVRKDKRKEKYKSTPKEKRAGAIALIVLGSIWTLGGFSMVAVLKDFLPFGLRWFIISFGFIIWGMQIYRQSKKEEAVKKETVVLPKAVPESKAEIPELKNRLWITVNTFNPSLPFIEGDNSISLFPSRNQAVKYTSSLGLYAVKVMSFDHNLLDNMKNTWRRHGIKTIKLYDDKGSCTEQDCGEKSYIGSEIENTLLKMLQNSGMKTLGQQSLYYIETDTLRRLLADTPLLVPFRYDGDNERDARADRQIHMTEDACLQLSSLLKEKDGRPKEEIPVYYGIEQLRGSHTVIIWNGDRVIYFGGSEIIKDVAEKNEISGNEHGKIMHPMFADNHKTNKHMVAAFTNMADLKDMYPHCRVALFSFRQLAALAKEGDGLVINPGLKGLCAPLDHETIEKLN